MFPLSQHSMVYVCSWPNSAVRASLAACRAGKSLTVATGSCWPKAEVRQSMSALASCIERYCFVSVFIVRPHRRPTDIDVIQIFPIFRSIALSALSLRSLYRSVR